MSCRPSCDCTPAIGFDQDNALKGKLIPESYCLSNRTYISPHHVLSYMAMFTRSRNRHLSDTPTDIARYSVVELPRSGKRLDVVVDQVAWSLPLLALQKWSRYQVPQRVDTRRLENLGAFEKDTYSSLGIYRSISSEAELYSELQLLRIESPPLSKSNRPSIRQKP